MTSDDKKAHDKQFARFMVYFASCIGALVLCINIKKDSHNRSTTPVSAPSKVAVVLDSRPIVISRDPDCYEFPRHFPPVKTGRIDPQMDSVPPVPYDHFAKAR